MHNCLICKNTLKNFVFKIKTCVAPMAIKLAPLKLMYCKSCRHLQKRIDDAWHNNMSNLYEKKYIFIGKHITVKKNKVFDRNFLIVKLLDKYLKLNKNGKLLDIGCGAGHFIKSFSEQKKNWELYAHDLTNLNKKIVDQYKVKKFYTGNVEKINKKFDLISLNHVVEHLIEPRKVLNHVNSILNDNGRLIIRLPNIKTVHNDLTVLDHCSHFTKKSLENLLILSGFKVEKFFNNFNKAELFVIAYKNKKKKVNISFSEISKKDIFNLLWLDRVYKKINEEKNKNIGLFGVGTSTFYLYAKLKNKIRFFVDEDSSKVGEYYYNRKIYSVSDAPRNSKVYIAVQNISESKKIKKRIKKENKFINFIEG